jgi:hypothetical protein
LVALGVQERELTDSAGSIALCSDFVCAFSLGGGITSSFQRLRIMFDDTASATSWKACNTFC